MKIAQLIQSGAAIRARERLGFYAVQSGAEIAVDQNEALRLVKEKRLVPSGKNKWGVMFFTWRA